MSNDLLGPQSVVKHCRAGMGQWVPEKALNHKFHAEYDLVQYKYDGWWIALRFLNGEAQFITSGAEIRKRIVLPSPFSNIDAVFTAEWMYGTNWAHETKRVGLIYVHDVHHIVWPERELDYPHDPARQYKSRLYILEECIHLVSPLVPGLRLVPSWFRIEAGLMWSQPSMEGLVLKKSESAWQEKGAFIKIKHTFDLDYVCMAVVEGGGRLKGRMGALAGGLFIDGKLKPMISVGGGFTDDVRKEIWENRDQYIGKVFEAYGQGLFSGRVLRHPNFRRWRPDKLPQYCVPLIKTGGDDEPG